MPNDTGSQPERVADPEATSAEYEAIFDTVSDALFLLDVDEAGTIRFVRFNERAQEVTGKSTAEVRGRTPVEVFGGDHGRAVQANYRECLERAEQITYEEERHVDGETTVWRTTLTPVTEDGQVQRIVGTSREVTELRASGQDLEQRLALLANTSDVITVLDDDGTVQYQNHRREHMPGPDSLDMVGMEQSEIIHPADRERAEETFEAVLEEHGAVARNELRIKRDNGEYRWCEQRVVNLLDDPAVGGVLVSSRDISDRKAKEAKLEGIFEAARDISFVIAEPTTDGADAVIREFSPGAERLFGYDREDVIGESIELLHHQADVERIPDIYETISSGDSWYDEVEHVRADGSTFDALLSIYPLELEGKTRFFGVSVDITERKERERALTELHAATRHLMTATTTEAVATVGSETASRVLGQTINGVHLYDEDAETLAPVAWAEDSESILDGPPPALPVADSLAGSVYRRGEPEHYPDLSDVDGRFAADTPFQSELILPLGDHGVFIFSATTTDWFGAVERTLAQVLAANVETALDRVDQRQRLERQNERLDEFASVVSHDLRNPLSVAETRLELEQRDSESEHLDHVERAHERISTLIDDLLTLAREGAGVNDVEPVELDSFVDQCWRHVETAQATVVSNSGRTIRADRSRLRQLLENLFRNAVDHGGSGVTITVGGLSTGFFLEDDGPGIPEDERDKVFDVGYSTDDDGNGFGLSIVKRVAEAHGWDVSVTAATDGGTRFEITGVSFVD
jgi:PAS domain S-box-containing protein